MAFKLTENDEVCEVEFNGEVWEMYFDSQGLHIENKLGPGLLAVTRSTYNDGLLVFRVRQ